MEKIQDTKLEDLVQEANQEFLNDLRKEGISTIKKLFSKYYVLTREINQDEKKLVEKKNSLNKTSEIIEKLKSGDWSALKVENKQEKTNE